MTTDSTLSPTDRLLAAYIAKARAQGQRHVVVRITAAATDVPWFECVRPPLVRGACPSGSSGRGASLGRARRCARSSCGRRGTARPSAGRRRGGARARPSGSRSRRAPGPGCPDDRRRLAREPGPSGARARSGLDRELAGELQVKSEGEPPGANEDELRPAFDRLHAEASERGSRGGRSPAGAPVEDDRVPDPPAEDPLAQ